MKATDRIFRMTFDTPVGRCGLLYRDRPFLLHKMFLPRQDQTDLCAEDPDYKEIPTGRHEPARRIAQMIQDYFNGKPTRSCRKFLRMDGLTELQRSVLEETSKIPFGRLRSYKEIAAAIGRPRACRFVGSALAKNPFPILIPCHRVIRSDGKIGLFGGGVELKRKMIALESGQTGP